MYVSLAGTSRMGALGRTYPEEIESTIRNIGMSLDLIMDSTLNLPPGEQKGVIEKVRSLNAQLTNEIVVPSDQLSDEEAKHRLWKISTDLFALEGIFRKAGVELKPLPMEPTTTGTATIPRADAKALSDRYKEAFTLFPNLQNRWPPMRAFAVKMAPLPFIGPLFVALTNAIDQRMKWLDNNLLPVDKLINDLKVQIDAGTDPIRFDRNAFDRLRTWIGSVFSMEDKIKRLEGEFLKKADPYKAPIPWGKIGLVAAGTTVFVGGLWYLLKRA